MPDPAQNDRVTVAVLKAEMEHQRDWCGKHTNAIGQQLARIISDNEEIKQEQAKQKEWREGHSGTHSEHADTHEAHDKVHATHDKVHDRERGAFGILTGIASIIAAAVGAAWPVKR
jgi:hypothetical protein